MARPKPDELQKELEEQDEIYGDRTEHEEAVDVEEEMERVVGSDFKETDPLDIAREIDDDEEAVRHGENDSSGSTGAGDGDDDDDDNALHLDDDEAVTLDPYEHLSQSHLEGNKKKRR